jgi:hypothetical protein
MKCMVQETKSPVKNLVMQRSAEGSNFIVKGLKYLNMGAKYGITQSRRHKTVIHTFLRIYGLIFSNLSFTHIIISEINRDLREIVYIWD